MPHLWIRGRCTRERLHATEAGLPALLAPVDAHRRLRGPYTAAGTVLRALIPELLNHHPELVRRHDIEILSAAPELRDTLPASHETRTSLAVLQERARMDPSLRTWRIAHGLTELLSGYLADGPCRMLIIDNAHHADPTDAELIAILLRRMDPSLLTLAVCTGFAPAIGGELASALCRHADERTVRPSITGPPGQPAGSDDAVLDDAVLAASYADTDCTSDDPALTAAYARLSQADRARLHDTRADVLGARGEQSLLTGAIPFHREHGSDPAGTGAEALTTALDYCLDMGFYHAAVDIGRRGHAVTDSSRQESLWWAFTTKMATALTALSRAREAEELYDEARALSTSPAIHLEAAYATAMLYTRHHEPARRNHRKAIAWINEAVAIASMLPHDSDRTSQSLIADNGRALIQAHFSDPLTALRILGDRLDRLDREPGTAQHRLLLLHNRARVLARLGRLEEALADHTAMITADPGYAQYYLDRGNILCQLGRDTEALADYSTTIRLSPPFPEVHYDRIDAQLATGDFDGALASLDYVLELDPDYLAACDQDLRLSVRRVTDPS
jgi:tetratricopeptide (TPR) repeat protein